MEKNIKQIITDDTGKTYEFVNGESPQPCPQLWNIELRAVCYDSHGHAATDSRFFNVWKTFTVERQFLVDNHLVPPAQKDDLPPQKAPEPIDLLIQLLEMAGVKFDE